MKEKFGLSKNGLKSLIFTAYLDDTPLVSFPEYRIMLYKEFVGDAFENAVDGVCHGCGKPGKVTSNFQKLEMKFFITDKISFASNLRKEHFYKNYTLCSDCYTAFSVAEKFIKNFMQTRFSIVPYKCYVIPEFLFQPDFSIEVLRDKATKMLNVTETLNYSDKWNEFRKEVEDLLESESFLLNYVFVEESNAAVKIKKIITDVPPSRIKQIIRERETTFEHFKNLIDPFETSNHPVSRLDFDRILYLFPVRKERPNNILEIYDSILTGKILDKKKLIDDFVEVMTIHYYSKYNSYVHKEPKSEDQVIFSVIDHVIDSNQFLYYAERLGIIKRGGVNVTDYVELSVLGDDVKQYVETLKLNEQELGLFLLGMLLSFVAKEQTKKGDGKKVILEKINYYGMPITKVLSFANEIFEKLIQYKVLNSYTELIHSLAKS